VLGMQAPIVSSQVEVMGAGGPTRGTTRTRTINTPGGGGAGTEDDSCAIVPASQVNPMRSLILLVVPALLLWGRRRRF